LLHSFSIGFHLLTIFIFAAVALIFINNEETSKITVEELDHIFLAITVVQVFNFISDCLLCVIFWQLGQNQQSESDKENGEYPEIEVVAFDDHAELQARIWN
jgi:hypothetical protein